MSLISRFNPAAGAADFWSEFTRPNPYRWPILALSCFLTFCLLFWVTKERVVGPPVEPDVTYISTFAEGRSKEEIIRTNKEAQARKEARIAEQEAIEERKRELYRQLGRATGVDVDKMEREIATEKAKEAAADQRKAEEMLGRPVAKPAAE